MNRYRFRHTRSAAAIGAVVLLGAAASGCGGEKLESRRLDREIAIDGTAGDWGEALVPLENRAVSIGMMNDDESLYLCLVTDDESIVRQLILHGMTTTFLPEGTKEEDAFRVLFPVGRRGDRPRTGRPPDGERPDESGQPDRGTRPETERRGWSSAVSDSVFREAIRIAELEGPGGRAPRPMNVGGAAPVTLAAGRTGETFVYEARVPLVGDDLQPAAVGVGSGGTFELRISTPEIDRPEMPGEPRGDGDGGGRDDGFGGRPGGFGGRGGMGGMGGMGRGGGRAMPEPLDVKFEVHLAAAP